MKAPLLIVATLMISSLSHSQTVLYSQDFESGGAGITMNTTDLTGTATGDNPWALNNVYAGGSSTFFCVSLGFNFPFTVPAAPTQPAGITNNPTSTYLHVTPQIALDAGGTLPAASYVVADGFCLFGGQTTFTKMSSDISTIGQDSVTLDLWWMCGGSTAYYGEVYYSTNGGVVWTAVNNPISGTNQWRGQTTWVNSVFTNANWDGQATLRFGYRFVSSATGTGSDLDPGFAVDDIVVTGFTSCSASASSISPSVCDTYTSPSGNYTHTSSITFNDTIPNMAGCDSVITINLTINSVDESVTQTNITLSALTGSATYQWLDCNNAYAPVAGATSQNYTATSNGDYALKITANGCTDTSACFTISEVGLGDYNSNSSVSIFPNPAHDAITINTGELSSGQIVITDVLGREILRQTIVSNITQIALQNLNASGTYVVRVINLEGEILGVEKLIIR